MRPNGSSRINDEHRAGSMTRHLTIDSVTLCREDVAEDTLKDAQATRRTHSTANVPQLLGPNLKNKQRPNTKQPKPSARPSLRNK